jgi:thioredoxin-related protein
MTKVIQWEKTLSIAKTRAKQENKLILMYFYDNFCKGCQQLATITCSDPAVYELVEDNFIALRIDSNDEVMFKRFNVKLTPTLIILGYNEAEQHRFIGYLPPEDFIAQIMLGKGKAEFDLDRLDQSVQWFQKALSYYPKTDAAPEAEYYLGTLPWGRQL